MEWLFRLLKYENEVLSWNYDFIRDMEVESIAVDKYAERVLSEELPEEIKTALAGISFSPDINKIKNLSNPFFKSAKEWWIGKSKINISVDNVE